MNKLVPLLRVNNLFKSYGKQQIIANLSFTVKHNDCLCIVGRSGIGKSVLVRLLTGLEPPDEGAIEYDGLNYSWASETEWNQLRRRIGLVFQQAALLDSLTVEENLRLSLMHLPKSAHFEQCQNIIQAVGLKIGVLSLYPAQLSGGMRKRVGIARALIHEPDIVFYDEPTAGLDPVSAYQIDRLIAEVHRSGRSSVIVTHDMHTARFLADQVLWLQDNLQYKLLSAHEFFTSNSELLVREQTHCST